MADQPAAGLDSGPAANPGAGHHRLSHGTATIAFHQSPGSLPGVIFLGGFQSDMTGTKALALETWAAARGRTMTRFDYQGHGASSGDFTDGTIGKWANDALAVLDQVTRGPQVLVGSSMGGWIMLLVALARPERVAGLVGIAPAPDFTEDLIWDRLEPADRATLVETGRVLLPSEYSEQPYPITWSLIEEARSHLLLRGSIGWRGPVRLIHGMNDPDVPWETSLRLAERLESNDVRVTLVKDGDHRLARAQDIELICRAVGELV
jgi:pimeloyl-ACP methyl ester carboxylesterase